MLKLRLGMIGSGFMARFHARAIKQVRNMDIAGLIRRRGSEELAGYVRQNGLGDGIIYDSIAQMAQHVDALAIYTPNYARLDILEEIVGAVRAGARIAGVICDKPLARNVAEARKMVNMAGEAGLHTAYFENQVFMKALTAQLVQLAPQQAAMGPMFLVRAAEEHAGPHEPWFWDPVRQGGGVLLDMGCHSIAASWYALTPPGKPVTYLQPVSVWADCALLKWGLPRWQERLKDERGVDYASTPAEDFVTGMVTYRNPGTGQLVKGQFTSSWVYEKQGMRLSMDGIGPGYAFEMNTLNSGLEIFIGDAAAEGTADAELAVEKATATRGLIPVQDNEADLYGYTDENEQAAEAFLEGKDAFLPWSYGLEIMKLVMAAYMSAEQERTIDLTDAGIQQELETFIPLIQQGRGAEVLFKN
jgi:predicted dehydrogenase